MLSNIEVQRTFPGSLKQTGICDVKLAERSFGGLDSREISEVLKVSEKTVLRDWNFAKLWLCRELSENAA